MPPDAYEGARCHIGGIGSTRWGSGVRRLGSQKVSARLAIANSTPLTDSETATSHVTLSGAASGAAESKGPPIYGGGPLRETRCRSCGDLSTRSRTHSLKVTCRRSRPRVCGTMAPTGRAEVVPESAGIWRHTGRAGHAGNTAHRGVPSLEFFFARALTVQSPSEKLQGGHAPRREDPMHLSRPGRRPSARHRRGRSPSIIPRATTPMVRRWDARGVSCGGPEDRGTGKQR